jgi:hypothetical protein
LNLLRAVRGKLVNFIEVGGFRYHIFTYIRMRCSAPKTVFLATAGRRYFFDATSDLDTCPMLPLEYLLHVQSPLHEAELDNVPIETDLLHRLDCNYPEGFQPA